MLGTLLLLLAALIWGSAFVAQSEGAEIIDPFTFDTMRCIVSGVILLPLGLVINTIRSKRDGTPVKGILEAFAYGSNVKMLIIGGTICGAILSMAIYFQQVGIGLTTSAKAGFITALYILGVPLIGLFSKKKVSPILWVCIAVALLGFYMLSMNPAENLLFGLGDLMLLLCAICFSFHIVTVDRFSPSVSGILLSALQFWVCGIISAVCMFIFEKPDLSAIIDCVIPILYAGGMSGAIAYTLQIVAQRFTEPTIASLAMSFESVFAAVSGWIILNEALNRREIIGCILIFAAVVIAQLPSGKIGRCKSMSAVNKAVE